MFTECAAAAASASGLCGAPARDGSRSLSDGLRKTPSVPADCGISNRQPVFLRCAVCVFRTASSAGLVSAQYRDLCGYFASDAAGRDGAGIARLGTARGSFRCKVSGRIQAASADRRSGFPASRDCGHRQYALRCLYRKAGDRLSGGCTDRLAAAVSGFANGCGCL